MPTNPPEYVFVDESGDPGFASGTADRFFLAAVHCDGPTLRVITNHFVNLHYHHGLGGSELKEWWPAKSADITLRQLQSCVRLFEKLTQQGALKATTVWVEKAAWQASSGPYTGGSAQDSFLFRNYVLKRLLRRHVARFGWGDNVDLVVDRYDLPERERARVQNLLNAALHPAPAHITAVSSAYVGTIGIADLYTKLVKRSLSHPDAHLTALCEALMSPREIRWKVQK